MNPVLNDPLLENNKARSSSDKSERSNTKLSKNNNEELKTSLMGKQPSFKNFTILSFYL